MLANSIQLNHLGFQEFELVCTGPVVHILKIEQITLACLVAWYHVLIAILILSISIFHTMAWGIVHCLSCRDFQLTVFGGMMY